MKSHDSISSHPSFRDICDLDASAFLAATDIELWNTQDDLIAQAPSLTRAKLASLETSSGQNCEPLGLMACKELRPYVQPTKTSFDSWHSYFVGGIAEVECDLMFTALVKAGITVKKISDFANERWRPNQSLKFTAHGVKGMASEVLRTVFIFWHLCRTVLQPRNLLLQESESFCALAESVHCLQNIKLLEQVPQSLCDRLAELQKKHADAHKSAYGTAYIRPKHHYVMHIPAHVKAHGMLIDTAPCERKQRLIKAHIQRMPNCDASKNCNIHITVAVNLYQLDEMQSSPPPGSLLGKTDLFLDANMQGRSARACVTALGLTLTAGDVLLVDGAALLFQAGLELSDGSLNFMVQRCRFNRQKGAGTLWDLLDEYVVLQEPDVSQRCLVRFSFRHCMPNKEANAPTSQRTNTQTNTQTSKRTNARTH